MFTNCCSRLLIDFFQTQKRYPTPFWQNKYSNSKIIFNIKPKWFLWTIVKYVISVTPTLRIHWRLSTILKINKKVYKVINKDIGILNNFWSVKVNIFWKFIQYAIHWDKTQMLVKVSSDKMNGTKMPQFFYRKLQLVIVLLLIHDSYMSWVARFVYSKLSMGFSIFDSVLFLLKFIFFFNKRYGLFDFKMSSWFHSKLKW